MSQFYIIHSESCGHCIDLMKQLKKMNGKMNEHNTQCMIDGVNIDLIEQQDNRLKDNTFEGHMIEGYPTILKRDGGSLIEHQGERSDEKLKEFFGIQKRGGSKYKKRNRRGITKKQKQKRRKTRKNGLFSWLFN